MTSAIMCFSCINWEVTLKLLVFSGILFCITRCMLLTCQYQKLHIHTENLDAMTEYVCYNCYIQFSATAISTSTAKNLPSHTLLESTVVAQMICMAVLFV
jgi:hypothetical protein